MTKQQQTCDACGHSFDAEPATLYAPATGQGMSRRWRVCPTCWRRVQDLFKVFKPAAARSAEPT